MQIPGGRSTISKKEGSVRTMKEIVNSPKAPAAIGPYSQAVKAGEMLFTSGQLGVDPATGELAGEDVASQARQALKNLGAILEEAGYGYGDTVKTLCFLSDMGDFAAFNAVYEEFFPNKPARSCVAVKQLPKNARCEIEAVCCK